MSRPYPELDAAAAAARLADFLVVDVREAGEFDGPLGHIAGAELVPLAQVRSAAARLTPLPRCTDGPSFTGPHRGVIVVVSPGGSAPEAVAKRSRRSRRAWRGPGGLASRHTGERRRTLCAKREVSLEAA